MTTEPTTPNAEPSPNDANLAQLRQSAADGKQARAELATARKENLFLRAGIDPQGNKLAQMLFNQWEGEDLAALKAEARDLGIKMPEDAPPPPDPDQGAQAFQSARDVLTGAAGTPAGAAPASTPNPIDAAYAEFYASLNRGVPREEAGLEALNRVMAAGASGDKRVQFDAVEWMKNAHPAVPVGL